MKQDTMRYVLGSSDQEIERLDRQSASIEAATRLLLRTAGIAPGMRVLDLGTGIGHVATLIADLVGPQGSVIGIDSNAGCSRWPPSERPRGRNCASSKATYGAGATRSRSTRSSAV